MGPQDIKHEEELNELEKRIQEAVQAKLINFSLVDDVLDAANLARNLERPRTEIEGRYHRAIQLAKKYGSFKQEIEASYQWAWTLYFWLEDYDFFREQYAIVESLTTGSRNAHDLELLTNLWYCLSTSVRSNFLNIQISNYQKHTDNLLSELGRLQSEQDRPSTALQAETLYLLVQIYRSVANGESPESLLEDLKNVVTKSEGLVGYPLEPLVKILLEIGGIFEGLDAYDSLFETIINVTSARDGEVRAARMLLSRGEKQLDQNRNIQAIATLGKALRLLYKNETRYEAVHALYLCGCAYEDMGLLWAARGTFLSAASIATNEYWQYGDITPHQAKCYRRIKWIELLLGRIPHILAWHQLDNIFCQMLVLQGYDSEALFSSESTFQTFLGRLMFRTEFHDLKYLAALPDVLDELNLELAADALLYVLGHAGRLEETCQNLGEDPDYFASQWSNIRADRPLPDHPHLYNKLKTTLQSRILGCQIIVSSQTHQPCIEVAESFLSALESLLATTTVNQAISREPKLTVDVQVSNFSKTLVSFKVEEKSGLPHIIINCRPFNPHEIRVQEQNQVKETLRDLTISTLAQIMFFENFEQGLEKLIQDERGLERSIHFTGTFGTLSNVLGNTPKTSLSAWVDDDNQVYALNRSEPWKPIELQSVEDEEVEPATTTATKSQTPPFDLNDLKHNEIETVSLIRERLWQRAGWTGVAFMIDPTNSSPPVLALIFKDQDSGREIFSQWRKELGEIDRNEQLRLSIIRGIDSTNPYTYRVMIGANLPLDTGRKFIASTYRMHKMDATTPDHLNGFLKSWAAIDAFFLAPAFVTSEFDGSQVPKFQMELSILVHSINVRNAWEIGPEDLDSMGIQRGDNPIIPAGITQAPVHSLLK